MDFSDSDLELEREDKILLEDLKKPSRASYLGDQDAVFGFGSDDDDDLAEDDDGDDISDIDMASDLEDRDDEKLPDDRAWGHKREAFYKTDFVDPDYAGGYGAEEEEAAKLEEEEAKNIQKRIMEQLSDAAFSLEEIADSALPLTEGKIKAVETDLSQLSKRQKLDLFKKEAPEFANLVDDFLLKLEYAREKISPILSLIKEGKLHKSSAIEFLETKFQIILNYCTNITFYLLLKAKRMQVKDHPVLKCLFRYRQLLNQLQPVDDEIISPQVEKILEVYGPGKPSEEKEVSVSKEKKLLKMLKKTMRRSGIPDVSKESESDDYEAIDEKLMSPNKGDKARAEDMDSSSDQGDQDEKNVKHEKRAITYEMAKNKGLTPKRSKEQRNPRVKHRNKFRKATIRRRGQVRMPRKEIPVYGGEPTGIKIGLKKGRKLM